MNQLAKWGGIRRPIWICTDDILYRSYRLPVYRNMSLLPWCLSHLLCVLHYVGYIYNLMIFCTLSNWTIRNHLPLDPIFDVKDNVWYRISLISRQFVCNNKVKDQWHKVNNTYRLEICYHLVLCYKVQWWWEF